MESENPATRRRLSVISAHFTPFDATLTHIFPVSCSSSMIQRRDNKTYFARQSSSSQACYMRPVSIQPANSGITSVNHKPLFSQPATEILKPRKATELPQFCRPNTRMMSAQKKLCCSKTKMDCRMTDFHWKLRLDVAESRHAFVVTVELPGVDANDIRVEITDEALNVKGNRSEWEKVKTDGPQNIIYRKKEISKGPFQVMMPLPYNVDKDSVSATFVDGFLQITIPRV